MFDGIVIRWLGSESCARIRIIIVSKCYWLLINHLSNRWYVIRRSSHGPCFLMSSFRRSFVTQFHSHVPGEITCPMTPIRERNLSCPSVFSMGPKKCHRVRIMIPPLKRCEGSFLSIADFCHSLFQCLGCSRGRPSNVFLFYILCRCDHSCWADGCHYCGPDLGHEKLNGLLICGVHA
jgi:hypothetical protein